MRPQPEPQAEDDSVASLFAMLIEDAENFVRAEVTLYRASIVARLTEARSAIVMILASFLLAQAAIIAFLVGLLVILLPYLGAAGATAAVVGSGLGMAGLLAFLAIGRLRKATQIDETPDE